MSGALGVLDQDDGENSAQVRRANSNEQTRDLSPDSLVHDIIDETEELICDIERGEDDNGDSIHGNLWSSNHDFYSRSDSDTAQDQTLSWDFLAVITAICEVYKGGTYLKMMMLDARHWKPLSTGSTFSVSRSEMKFSVYSSRDHRRKETVSNRVVMKRNTYYGDMTAAQVRSFVKELRVLHHLSNNPFIVNLRGVGWFDKPLDESTRYFNPALILEEAFNTLDYLIGPTVAMAYEDMLEIFGQMTLGLRALHQCSLVHGDLKPGNVLLFERLVSREGVQIKSYLAKLSDFESVACKAEKLSFCPGTRGYRAPEVDRAAGAGGVPVSFEQLMMADAWSLGMVFAVMLLGDQDFLEEINPIGRVKEAVSGIKTKLESSTTETAHAMVAIKLLEHTLRQKPTDRDLDLVERELEPFLRDVQPNR